MGAGRMLTSKEKFPKGSKGKVVAVTDAQRIVTGGILRAYSTTVYVEWDDLKGESYPVSIKLSLPNKDKLPTKENTKFADDCILKRIEGSRRRMKSYDSSWLEISVPNPEKMKEFLQMLVRNGQAMEVTPAWKANFPTWWHQNQCFIRRRLAEEPKDSSVMQIAGLNISTAGATAVVGGTVTITAIPSILKATGALLTPPSLVPMVTVVVVTGATYMLSTAGLEYYSKYLEEQKHIELRRATQADAVRVAAKEERREKMLMKCIETHDVDKCIQILSSK